MPDVATLSRADVLCDLDHLPYRFRDSSFDRLQAVHVIEHVAEVIRSIEEFHRPVRAGGEVIIVTPYYTDFSSFCDPTHRWHLNSFSLRYFGDNHGGFGYYSAARFEELSVHLKLLALWRWLGFELAVNAWPRFRRFWEHYLCYIVRGKAIEWRLRVIKQGHSYFEELRAPSSANWPSMIFSNSAMGCAPLRNTPLTKKPGVPATPTLVPCSKSAAILDLNLPLSRHV